MRAGKADCDFSLSEQYAGRYEHHTGKSRIPKLFYNCRSSWVTELVKVFGVNKHDCAKWIGHTEAIQDSNYLQMISEDIHQAMDDAMEAKGCTKGCTTYTGSHSVTDQPSRAFRGGLGTRFRHYKNRDAGFIPHPIS